MNKKEILKILEKAVDENGDIPMRLVRQAFDKLPEECDDTVSRDDVRKAIRDFYDGECIASEEFEHKYLSRIPQKLPPVIPKSYSEYRSKIPMEHYEIDLPPTVRDDTETVKEEALRILDAINTSGRLDYGDYCDLHDAISLIPTS